MIEAAEETKDGSYFVAQEKWTSRTYGRNNGWPLCSGAKVLLG